MYINQIFELSMVLDNEKFYKILDKVICREVDLEETNDGYVDDSLESKGIIVKFRNSQYKKKVTLVINSGLFMDNSKQKKEKFILKLDKHIGEYFRYKYQLNDFDISKVILTVDINIGNREDVVAYLKVLQRIGKVKGFSPALYEGVDEKSSFCLNGNSNGISFLIYDLEGAIIDRHKNLDVSRKKLKSIIEDSEGVLRAEVRLTKPQAIRLYIEETEISEQMTGLMKKSENIFMETFIRVIPFGDYYKKGKAEEIIRSEAKDIKLRRRMLRLLELISEKKSLYLAQKALNCRNIEKVMDGFAKINVSPITISKRQDEKYLKCIYDYLVDEK